MEKYSLPTFIGAMSFTGVISVPVILHFILSYLLSHVSSLVSDSICPKKPHYPPYTVYFNFP